MEKAKLPKIEEEKLNISKVAKYISTTAGLIDAEINRIDDDTF